MMSIAENYHVIDWPDNAYLKKLTVRMNMKNRVFGYIVALLLTLLVFPAQGESSAMNASGVPNLPLSVDPTGRTEGFSAILYNNPNGLPTSEANAITETSEGFIWLGSYAGLIRYDGNTFERFDSTTGIANVRCLFTDRQDRLWIGTNDSGVFLMEKGTLRQWDKAEGMKSSSIRAVAEGADGLIYVGSTFGIALFDKNLNLTDLEDERISALTIRELRPGEDGLVYGLTASGDVFVMENGKITVFLSHEDTVESIISILPDPERPFHS